MISTETIKAYQRLIQTRFPEVIVLLDPDCGHMDDGHLGAFGVPDDQVREYTLFTLNELPGMAEKEGLPLHALLMHTRSVTEQYYPAIFALLPGTKEECITQQEVSWSFELSGVVAASTSFVISDENVKDSFSQKLTSTESLTTEPSNFLQAA